MTRSEAVTVDSLWSGASGEIVRVTKVIGFPRIAFVRYAAVLGCKSGPERTLDRKAFLHRFHVVQVSNG